MTQILRKQPENAELVEKILFSNPVNSSLTSNNHIDLVQLLRHTSPLLRARICHLLRLIAKFSCRSLQNVWNAKIQETLEALVYDSIENVRNVSICKYILFFKYFDSGEQNILYSENLLNFFVQ